MLLVKLVLGALAMLPLCVAAGPTYLCPGEGKALRQLRIYELNRDNRDAFHARFQDHALRIMKKHQFEVMDMWESDSVETLQFIYVLAWPDEAKMESRWKAFLADREWIDIKKRSAAEHGELVRSTKGQILRRVSYSPACQAG